MLNVMTKAYRKTSKKEEMTSETKRDGGSTEKTATKTTMTTETMLEASKHFEYGQYMLINIFHYPFISRHIWKALVGYASGKK